MSQLKAWKASMYSLPTEYFTYYYSRDDSRLEVDFVAQHKGEITAVEVKAEENLRAKSLRVFTESHQGIKAVRFSMSPYREQDWMRNIPLYAVEESF